MFKQEIEKAYSAAQRWYARQGIDTKKALNQLKKVPVSLPCWQGDDVKGFESAGAQLSDGGLVVTGAYPGRANSPQALRQDLEKTLSLIPGKHRVNLHAIYGEFGGKKIDRNNIEPRHFQGWIDWAKKNRLGLDFNPTFFSHPLAADGWTLSNSDPKTRSFWIEHGRRCRAIGAEMGKQLSTPAVVNVWVPDGSKETPIDRDGPRTRLAHSLDAIFEKKYSRIIDSVESKLFGIGSESYVTGSHEFYLGYAVTQKIGLCLDTGHFHPTEIVGDKLSAIQARIPHLLLHVSRGVRWDSDHVVTLTDELQALAAALVRGNHLSKTSIGLDYFDATINRLAAWIIGARNMLKALLIAFLEPTHLLLQAEKRDEKTRRLALVEGLKTQPWGAVWDYYCRSSGTPTDLEWMGEIERYEEEVFPTR